MSGDHDGAMVCKSIAKLDPLNVHSVLSMSSCAADPLARVSQGQKVRLHSVSAESAHAADDVMFLYINPM